MLNSLTHQLQHVLVIQAAVDADLPMHLMIVELGQLASVVEPSWPPESLKPCIRPSAQLMHNPRPVSWPQQIALYSCIAETVLTMRGDDLPAVQ